MPQSSQTPDRFGDPREWDWIPTEWTEEFIAAMRANGHTVVSAHETAISVRVPDLGEGRKWFIGKPTFHGLWSYGVADERGVCDYPCWIYGDAADPQEIADMVHAILSGAPLEKFWHGGTFAVYPATAKGGTE